MDKTNKINIEAIVAFDSNKGIAKDGLLPWSIKEDMAFFKENPYFIYLIRCHVSCQT